MAKTKKETPTQYLVINPNGYRLVFGKRPADDSAEIQLGGERRKFLLGRDAENAKSGLGLNKLANDFLKLGGWEAAGDIYGNAQIFADARSMKWVIGLIEQVGGKDIAVEKKKKTIEE